MKFSSQSRAADRSRWQRWAFNEVFDIGQRGDVMMRRRRLIQTPWFGLYLHTFYRPDAERDLHDHPWNFTTLILRGSYREQHRWPQIPDSPIVGRFWRRWSIHHMSGARDAHRITEVADGTLTIVLVGRKHREWGFYTETEYGHGWLPWREYLGVGEGAGERLP